MPAFNIANTKGRDAVVLSQGVRKAMRVRWLDADQRQCTHVRVVRSTLQHDVKALSGRIGEASELSEVLVRSDPEVDIESFGRMLRDTCRVYVDEDGDIVNHVQEIEVLYNPDGSERERRPRVRAQGNVNAEEPIRLSGRTMRKREVYNRFVFTGKRQLMHVNGLTYDFLYAIAKELAEADSLMLVGSGAKGMNPIILNAGGTPYRGFLEGRIDGEKYCLILHLSNMELKTPPRSESAKGENA